MFLRKSIFIILLSAILMLNMSSCSGTKQNDEIVADGEKNSEAYYHPITDQEIQKELEFIQDVLQVNKEKAKIEKAFDDRYHKYVIPREALDVPNKQGLNDIHFYIYSGNNSLLSFEVGEIIYSNGFESGIITEVKENSIITQSIAHEDIIVEDPKDAFFLNMDLFVDNLLLKRKSGIKIEILYSDKDLVLGANVFYLNKEDKVTTISYERDGTINTYKNVTREEHYKSF